MIQTFRQQEDFTDEKMVFMVSSFLQPKMVLNIFDINKSMVVDSIKNESCNLNLVKNLYSIITNTPINQVSDEVAADYII